MNYRYPLPRAILTCAVFEVAREEFFDSAGRQYIVLSGQEDLPVRCLRQKHLAAKGWSSFLGRPGTMLFAVPLVGTKISAGAVTCFPSFGGKDRSQGDLGWRICPPPCLNCLVGNPSFKYRITGVTVSRAGREKRLHLPHRGCRSVFCAPHCFRLGKAAPPKQQGRHAAFGFRQKSARRPARVGPFFRQFVLCASKGAALPGRAKRGRLEASPGRAAV